MKQTKHKHCTSIWHNMPKGVRAGNSPVWKGDTDQLGMGEDHEGEKQASENISEITNKQRNEERESYRKARGLLGGYKNRRSNLD